MLDKMQRALVRAKRSSRPDAEICAAQLCEFDMADGGF